MDYLPGLSLIHQWRDMKKGYQENRPTINSGNLGNKLLEMLGNSICSFKRLRIRMGNICWLWPIKSRRWLGVHSHLFSFLALHPTKLKRSAGKWNQRLCELHVGPTALQRLDPANWSTTRWILGAKNCLLFSCLVFNSLPSLFQIVSWRYSVQVFLPQECELATDVSPYYLLITPNKMAKLLMRLSNSPSRKSDAFRNMTTPLIVTSAGAHQDLFVKLPVMCEVQS